MPSATCRCFHRTGVLSKTFTTSLLLPGFYWESKALFLITTVFVFARAFVVGLSDEAGAAANVALAVKARQSPKPEEVARLDEYIQRTLWGVDQHIPFPVSLQDHASGGIRASLFWVPTPVCALRCHRGLHSNAFTPFLMAITIVFIPCSTAGHRLQSYLQLFLRLSKSRSHHCGLGG